MLTGRVPFTGERHCGSFEQLQEPVPSPEDRAWHTNSSGKLLRPYKEPRERFASADEFMLALEKTGLAIWAH